MRLFSSIVFSIFLFELFLSVARAQNAESTTPKTDIKNFYIFKCETRWGNGGLDQGQFNEPNAISVDPSDNVYVSDSKNNRIQKFDANGKFILAFGEKGEPYKENSKPNEFGYLEGVCVDKDGFIYVAVDDDLRKYDPNFGFVSKVTITNDSPLGIFIGGDGFLYLPENSNNLAKYSRNFREIVTYPLQNRSFGFALDNQLNFYASYTPSEVVEKYNREGEYQGEWKKKISPLAIAFDQGNWGYFGEDQKVLIYKPDGEMILKFGAPGVAKGQFGKISGIAIGTQGEIFILDRQNNRVQKFVKYKVTQWFDKNGIKIKEEEIPLPEKELPINLTKTALYDPASEANPFLSETDNAKKNSEKGNKSSNSSDVADKAKDAAVDTAKNLLGF